MNKTLFKYFPFFVCPFWLSENLTFFIGGSSKTKQTQNTDQSTTIETTNKQVGASEGSVGIGAGANVRNNQGINVEDASGVSFTSVDDKVIDAATGALTSAGQTVGDALNFGDTALERGFEAGEEFQRGANDLIRQGNEILTNFLGKKTEDSDSTEISTLQKNLLIGAGLFGVFLVVSKSKLLKRKE